MSFLSMLRGNKKYVEQERQETEHQEVVASAMILAMASVASADGMVDESELTKMAQIYGRITGLQAHPDRIQAVVETALAAEDNVEDLMSAIAADMEHTDKANVLHAAVLIAMADSDFDIAEQSEIWRIAQAFGVSAESLKDIIERATAS